MTAGDLGNLLLLAPKTTQVALDTTTNTIVSPTGSSRNTTPTSSKAHAMTAASVLPLAAVARPPSLPSLLSYSDILVRATMAETLRHRQVQAQAQALRYHPQLTAPSLNTANTTIASPYELAPAHKLRQTQLLQKIKQQQQEQPPQTICIPKPFTATPTPLPPAAEVVVPAAPTVALSRRPRLVTAPAPIPAAPTTTQMKHHQYNHQPLAKGSSTTTHSSSSFKKMMMFGNPLSAPPSLVRTGGSTTTNNKKRVSPTPAPISCILLDSADEPVMKKRKVLSSSSSSQGAGIDTREEEVAAAAAPPLPPPVRRVSLGTSTHTPAASSSSSNASAKNENHKILTSELGFTSELLQAAQRLQAISGGTTTSPLSTPKITMAPLTNRALKPPPSLIAL